VLFSLAGVCSAEVPGLYKTVDRVTWVVENIDKVRPALEALGLSGIEEYPNIRLMGEFRGKAITIYAWQITGHLGNLTVDLIQPGEGQANAYTDFLAKHGDGILSIVHEVESPPALEQEILRMKAKGVAVLQVTVQRGKAPVTHVYFDTEREGKFALGLVYRPGGMRAAAGPAVVSHFGAVVWDAAAVSAYWEKLGFPPFSMERARDEPLSLAFDVGSQRHTQFRYEWISPPPSPANIYADFLNRHHREGIQHIGMPVDDLARSVAAYERLGYHVRQAGAQYAYMDTDSVGGISVELVQGR
ncbi:MAG TPA: VOC family protein, partial [Vicinamibacteria bacterium]|nr:VOC family protein [Vicinamibacteria bacterium]